MKPAGQLRTRMLTTPPARTRSHSDPDTAASKWSLPKQVVPAGQLWQSRGGQRPAAQPSYGSSE